MTALNLINNNNIYLIFLLFTVPKYWCGLLLMFLKNKIYCIQWEKSCFLPRHLKITYLRPVMAIL